MTKILTCDSLDVRRARAVFGETPYESGPDGFIRPQEGWDIAKKIRQHDESLGLSTDDLLAVLNGEAKIVRMSSLPRAEQSCKNCAFNIPLEGPPDPYLPEDFHFCVKRSPGPLEQVTPNRGTRFPILGATAWCGDWEEVEK